ncbi:MAG TPA: glucoamylase family protein, partial [Burkholderiaceae bacterium]|nr:glucoamylase family protein [Burkholderiaceae bacterium]
QAFFDGDNADEGQIRRIVNELTARVDWRWAQTRAPAISLGWTPEKGFLPYDWRGYNEAAVVYLLAMGHPTRPLDGSLWNVWTRDFHVNWSTFHGQQGLSFPPLFGHQYSNVWVDFRDLRDDFSRRHNIDYAENSRRAAYAQRAYAMLNPKGWRGYDADVWGLTACDGPGNMIVPYRGEPRRFYGYAARGAGGGKVSSVDDGTIAPTAAASSIAFAPDIAIPAIITMVRRHGQHIYGKYGFFDAFNLSFHFETPHLTFGKVVKGFGWVDTDYLGIDQGPILAMIANFTNGSVWQTMTKCAQLRRGLQRAGFSGGWLEEDA